MDSFARQGVLFDLDGVLVDSTPCASRIWKAWAREQGLDPEYMVQVAHGRPTVETVRLVAPNLDAAAETAKIEDREVNDVEGLKVLPGAKELLTSLPGESFTIVTSGSRRLATARLRAAGLPVPERMITADDITNGKPDPEPYLKGAKLLGFPPAECLVFEDAPPGIVAAKAAAMTVIALPNTYAVERLSEADLIVDSLQAIHVEIAPSGALKIEVAAAVKLPSMA